MGSNTVVASYGRGQTVFQSTLPGWGATCMPLTFSIAPLNFNPRSPDGERLQGRIALQVDHEISIHAPRMGSDRGHPGRRTEGPISIHAPRMGSDDRLHHRRTTVLSISIHAPRMGSDCLNSVPFLSLSIFQSTLPGWGATLNLALVHHVERISIHAPRVGSDIRRRLCLFNRKWAV